MSDENSLLCYIRSPATDSIFLCAAYELFGLAKSLQKSYLLPSQLLMYLLSPYVIKVLRVFTFGCTLTFSFITNVCKTLEYQTK